MTAGFPQRSPGPRLELRQSQSLVMTQQLQQSIKLLQLSSLEVMEFVEQELEKNPLLTEDEAEGAGVAENADREENDAVAAEEGEAPQAAPTLESPVSDNDGYDSASLKDGWDENDAPQQAAPDESFGQRISGSAYQDEDGENYLERTLSREVTLREHLLGQLQMDITDPAMRLVGLNLIDLVDEAGYIKDDLAQAAATLGCDMAMIEATLALMQRFDPVGVCARNLAECLAIQLRDRDRFDPAMQAMIAHLELLGKGDMEGLRRRCGVDMEDMKEMVAEIRRLNPKPGLQFSSEMVQSVSPEVLVRRIPTGGWQVELNPDTLPRVLVNQRYFAQLSSHTRDKVEKKYLTEQLATANWLVKALDQRANTILKVATEIVKQQDDFLRNGIRYLKPLTLKDIALAVEMHESTVSRVTTSKFMATPRGTYELKYFFTSSVGSSFGGDDVSSRSVQHMIKELIDAEKPDNILSDDTLAEMLKDKGIDVARRTVAKYREALRIASSVQRRRAKKGF